MSADSIVPRASRRSHRLRRFDVRKAILLCALVASAADAQPSPMATQSHAVRLIKLPNGDYTVPMSALAGSGSTGKVTLHPQGPKTLVTVYVLGNGNHKHAFNLHSGKDCAVVRSPSTIALAPAMTGQPSRTLVSLPIGDLAAKDYVVEAHNATAKRQFEEACARL